MTTERPNNRVCENCNKGFYAPRKKKYCGKDCQREGTLNNQPKVTDNCIICNKETQVFKFAKEQDLPTYCSPECKSQRYEHECKNCGKVFRGNKADTRGCSPKCSMAIARSHEVEVTCVCCGEVFNRPSMDVYSGKEVYCSVRCSNREYSRRHPNRYGTTWTTARRRKFKEQSSCQECGSVESLEVHHIIKFLSFGTPEEANKLDNLQVLCKSCHSNKHK